MTGLSRTTPTMASILNRIAEWKWPTIVGTLCMVLGLTALAASWFIKQEAQSIQANISPQAIIGEKPQDTRSASDAFADIPADTQYLSDLGRMLKIAQEGKVSVGVIEYKVEINPKLPLTVRSIELRANDEYPRVKGFLSHVLMALPNASLQEIRIERKDATTAQGAIVLKLSLVYKTDNSGVAVISRESSP